MRRLRRRTERSARDKILEIVEFFMPDLLAIRQEADAFLEEHDSEESLPVLLSPELQSALDDTTSSLATFLTPMQRERLRKGNELASELEQLSSEELDSRYEPILKQRRLEESTVAHEEDAAVLHNSDLHADLEHWRQLPFWTIDEAVALSFGLEPGSAALKALDRLSDASSLKATHQKVVQRLSRAVEAKQFSDNEHVTPGEFARWFKNNNVRYPAELSDLLNDNRNVVGGLDDELKGKRLSSVYRIIRSLAFPKASERPSEAELAKVVNTVKQAAERRGEKIDDETARDYLRAALEAWPKH